MMSFGIRRMRLDPRDPDVANRYLLGVVLAEVERVFRRDGRSGFPNVLGDDSAEESSRENREPGALGPIWCWRCNEHLGERDAYCTRCGEPVLGTTAPACATCGTELSPGRRSVPSAEPSAAQANERRRRGQSRVVAGGDSR